MESSWRALISPQIETITNIARHAVKQLHEIPKADDESLEMTSRDICLVGGLTVELVGDWTKCTPWDLSA